jgi:hypothetical protein
MLKLCLNCKFFHLEDRHSGRCRIDRGSIDPQAYPNKLHQDHCDRWQDAGQRYFIRTGWLKKQEKIDSE